MLLNAQHFTRRYFLSRSGSLLSGVFISAPAFANSLSRSGSTPQLGKIIDELYAAYEALDQERLLNLLTDDCFFEDPTFHLSARGKPELKKLLADMSKHFSNIRVAIENRIVCRDWVITQQTLSGIINHSTDGSGEGRKISVRGATIFGFKNGKINRWSDYYDFATYQKQTRQQTQQPN